MSDKDVLQPAQSRIWQSFEAYRGKVKRNKKGDQFYQWDYTHGDIEVYNRRGEHLGCLDGETGDLTKPPVKGRTIKISWANCFFFHLFFSGWS